MLQITKIAAAFFLLILVTNCNSVLPEKTAAAPNVVAPPKADLLESAPAPLDEPQVSEKQHEIEMLLTGTFHADEITAKSGEMWFGLFRKNGKSVFVKTKIKVASVRDEIVDEAGEKTGKEVGVNYGSEPIFLLKDPKNLSKGAVETLFYSDSTDETQQYSEQVLHNGSKKIFELKGQAFALKVVNEKSSDENDLTDAKLVLVSGDTEQILYQPTEDGFKAEFLSVLWIGDLDRDGKPDLFLDISRENQSGYTLFLSSHAEKGKLVKEVAAFGTVGC